MKFIETKLAQDQILWTYKDSNKILPAIDYIAETIAKEKSLRSVDILMQLEDFIKDTL
jgi:hypothetical protein